MNKKEFIDLYIVNFIATYEANHINWHAGEEVITMSCDIQLAKRSAEDAWHNYSKGIKDGNSGA